MSGFSTSEYARELATGDKLAREAGAVALRFHGGKLDVEMKTGDEPVTEADRACSDLIVRGLAAAFPDDIIISEENADDLRRLGARRVWYIDPIDGTKDFIRGESGFSIMIGLAVENRPAVGVVYQPTEDRMFAAATGAGTWVSERGAEARRVHCSEVSELSGIRLVSSRSHRSNTMDQVKSTLGIADERSLGSVGLKLGVIAAGERDLYVNPSTKTKMWDTCAPEALLVEAGGRISDIRGRPLCYDTEDTKHHGGLLASNGRVHDAVVEKLAALFPGEMPD